jgi:hypothetical protein
MNDQFRELGKEATLWCVNQPNQDDFDAMWEEKFAELLIQECLDIADQYDGAGSMIVDRIKERFGIEE